MRRWRVVAGCALGCALRVAGTPAAGAETRAGRVAPAGGRPPNFVVILADDLGYGDLGAYGHPGIRTPHLDRMAAEGMRFTDFYAAAPVCTPSRAALLTGRYPARSGMVHETRRVLFPDSAGGLPPEEITLAEGLAARGYATACIGKWHLGHRPAFLPTRQGFDAFFGLPYSNDMDDLGDPKTRRARLFAPTAQGWNVPLMRNEETIERPVDQSTLTRRYTEEAIAFIRRNRARPFFLYVAHSMPHVPLLASKPFAGKSPRGPYGDAVEEIDHGVGEILRALRELRLDRRTLVVFTSDNGPWTVMGEHGGSAGLLREGKGTTWEGGMRVPALFWWPGRIPAGAVNRELVSALDLFPTLLGLAGAKPPADRPIDGVDVTPVLLGIGRSARETFFYYRNARLQAVRKGRFKAHVETRPEGASESARHDPPLLFDLGRDPSERFDVAKQHPEVVADLLREIARQEQAVQPAPSQLEARLPRE